MHVLEQKGMSEGDASKTACTGKEKRRRGRMGMEKRAAGHVKNKRAMPATWAGALLAACEGAPGHGFAGLACPG